MNKCLDCDNELIDNPYNDPGEWWDDKYFNPYYCKTCHQFYNRDLTVKTKPSGNGFAISFKLQRMVVD